MNNKDYNAYLADLFNGLDDSFKNSPLGNYFSSCIDFLNALDEYEEENDDKSTDDNTDTKTVNIESDDTIGRHVLPSEKLDDMDKKLEIHKIVQSYVDTEIKPYVSDVLTQEQISDAYSALYEFACWILNK